MTEKYILKYGLEKNIIYIWVLLRVTEKIRTLEY